MAPKRLKTEIELKKGNYSNYTQNISDVIGCAHGEKKQFSAISYDDFQYMGLAASYFQIKPYQEKNSLHQGLIINSCSPCYPVSVSICQHNLPFWQSNMVCCTIHQQWFDCFSSELTHQFENSVIFQPATFDCQRVLPWSLWTYGNFRKVMGGTPEIIHSLVAHSSKIHSLPLSIQYPLKVSLSI